MDSSTYTKPTLFLDAFNCAHCKAYAHQDWKFIHQSGTSTEAL